MRFSFEKGSLELLYSSVGVDNSGVGSMVWLIVLILEVRKHQICSQLSVGILRTLVFHLNKLVQLYLSLHRTFIISVINLSPRWGRNIAEILKNINRACYEGKTSAM